SAPSKPARATRSAPPKKPPGAWATSPTKSSSTAPNPSANRATASTSCRFSTTRVLPRPRSEHLVFVTPEEFTVEVSGELGVHEVRDATITTFGQGPLRVAWRHPSRFVTGAVYNSE